MFRSTKTFKKNCNAVIITSDKDYKNQDFKRGYSEDDELGGYDPYSASKGAAEFAIRSHVGSYFDNKSKIKIGVARAGNVIGGGDWSDDRLLPDCVKSWAKKQKAKIRNPTLRDPGNTFLEAISGYLLLAAKLKLDNRIHGEAFNFGPKFKS